MTNIPMALEIDCSTGVETLRPLTAEEITQRETDAATFAIKEAEYEAFKTAKAEAKLAAQAKLAALGLTPEEINAITN